MTEVSCHLAGETGARPIDRSRPALEALPTDGPPGVTPDLWARAIVADRGTASWAKFTVGELLQGVHLRHVLYAVVIAGSGSGVLARLVF